MEVVASAAIDRISALFLQDGIGSFIMSGNLSKAAKSEIVRGRSSKMKRKGERRMSSFFCYNETKIGTAFIRQEGEKIAWLSFGERSTQTANEADATERSTSLTREAFRQLDEYFAGRRFQFDLPLGPTETTPFRLRVWEALREIPWGVTRSYQEIAERIGNRNAARAVGNACGKNQILILIPCHRVVASDGTLGGFSSGLELKRRLLRLENSLAPSRKGTKKLSEENN